MQKFLLIILIPIIALSCGPSHEADEAEEMSKMEMYFPDFPEKHFKGISLGDTREVCEMKLSEEAFSPKPGLRNNFFHKKSNIEMVVPDADEMNSFKLFFYDKDDINISNEFSEFFSDFSYERNLSDEFSVYYIRSNQQEFSVTMFLPSTHDLIRLNFELKSSH